MAIILGAFYLRGGECLQGEVFSWFLLLGWAYKTYKQKWRIMVLIHILDGLNQYKPLNAMEESKNTIFRCDG